MGRPINKHYIGNVNTGGHVIVGQAWVPGDSQARLSYIVKQKASTSYIMAPIDGNGVPLGGRVSLVNGPVLQAGQANITITPSSAIETGMITGNVGIAGSITTSSIGTGAISASYAPGEILTLTGGTPINGKVATVIVNAVQVRMATIQAGGANYTVGDAFTFSGSGYAQEVSLEVATVSNGAVATVTISSPGEFNGGTLPANPVTPSTQIVTDGAATGATFNLAWGILLLGVEDEGDYSTVPANPIAVTGSANGTGASIDVQYTEAELAISLAKLTDTLAYGYNGISYQWTLVGGQLLGPNYAILQSK
jgi:hypothetical protein